MASLLRGEVGMTKLISWISGLVIGTITGVLAVILFAPISGEEATQRLRDGYGGAFNAAAEAAQKRRAELEAELSSMQKDAVSDKS